MKQASKQAIEHSIKNLPDLAIVIREKGIWFKKIEVEYRKNNKMFLVRLKGSKSMKLSDNYLQTIKEQLEKLNKDYILPLTKQIRNNYIVTTYVNAQGKFTLSDVDLRIKVDCSRGIGMEDTFREPFRVLQPFALFMLNIDFRGRQYKATVVETEIKISKEDISDIVSNPSIAPRTRKQWADIGNIVFLEAKEAYHYEVSIPCIEGEIYWDNKESNVQFTYFEQKL